jgi:secondary thiamine-phosphate synthase enzyme
LGGIVEYILGEGKDCSNLGSSMPIHQRAHSVRPRGKGLHEITELVAREVKQSGMKNGTATIFCQHTSCSLVIMENADPTARADLESWLDRLVPANDPHFGHTLEGPDDMPSHIKMVLTRTSETVPFSDGKLLLGTWQGIYLWEHRRQAHTRTVIITVLGE